jgi:hypothetical protein
MMLCNKTHAMAKLGILGKLGHDIAPIKICHVPFKILNVHSTTIHVAECL